MKNETCCPDIKALAVDLPEDIEKKKWFGDFKGAIHLIDLWLTRDIPETLRDKLVLEKEILQILPHQYTMNYTQALAALREKIPDFAEEEFADLKDHGKIDWIYVYGEEKYFESFVSTLLLENPALKKRAEKTDPSLGKPDPEEELLSDIIHQIKEKQTLSYYFQIKASVRISDDVFQPGHVMVHMPVPCLSKQVKEMKLVSTSSPDYVLADETAPQRTICYEENMTENHPFSVTYEYVNHVDYVDVDVNKVKPINPDEFEDELSEKLPHIRFTPYMKSLAEKLTAGITNPYLKAKSIYDYITTKVEYSYVRNYSTIENLSEYAAIGHKGDCGIQSLMFITLCRLAGIPAKWQSGLYTTPYSAGMHDWAQFYIAPYGWLFADCSFGGSAYMDHDEEKRQFYFGNIDPFRMPANSDIQENFTPGKKYLRADTCDNQRGEIEYDDRGLRSYEFRAGYEVKEARPL